jgi:PadR family transcriptional regulator, regulatory protein PadR
MRLEPWLLLFLASEDLHGYELLARLNDADGAPSADAGNLYRTLRRLEEQQVVVSAWDAGGKAGPARRVYTLTPAGHAALAAWVAHISAAHGSLSDFLQRYGSFGAGAERASRDESGGRA